MNSAQHGRSPSKRKVSIGVEQEKLKIGQAPHHPLQLSRLGAHKLELFYMNQGAPQIVRMQGGIRNLGMLFHLALRGGLWPIDRPSLSPSPCLGVTSGGGGAKNYLVEQHFEL